MVCVHAKIGPNLHLCVSLTKEDNYRSDCSLSYLARTKGDPSSALKDQLFILVSFESS